MKNGDQSSTEDSDGDVEDLGDTEAFAAAVQPPAVDLKVHDVVDVGDWQTVKKKRDRRPTRLQRPIASRAFAGEVDGVCTKRRLRARRLTLAPTAQSEVDVDDAVLFDEAERILDSERMAREMELAVAMTSKPRPHVHGVEDFKGSRFCALSESDPSSDDEGSEPESLDTPEFVKRANDCGFTMSELAAAGNEISDASYSALDERSVAKRIVDAVVNTRPRVRPWKGSLPPPRKSPPMTLAAAMDKAQVLYRGTHWLRFWTNLQPKEEDQELIMSAC
ncbi:uncharacterized protein LOC133928763 isoform X1 [Phragmites australis]|uniref:uncharacterized protein LOC133928763 isoform X1 n=1 Tax=Phragmites australis TaxID=29695 RepID=UPI002D780735|nr:uncharacterized protein LOC133928763 isoform X1 [Phragmites australis]